MPGTNPAARFGPIAEQEYNNAADHHKPQLAAWIENLSNLSDDDFFWQAATAIHGSALAASFRGNWEHEHCKATVAWKEAARRHTDAGHDPECRGETIYSRAHAQVMREQGLGVSPASPCTCGAAQ